MKVDYDYDCDQCDHKYTQNGALKKHKQSVHEGLRYECDQCEYRATDKESLKRHKRSKHGSLGSGLKS